VSNTADLDILDVTLKSSTIIVDVVIERVLTDTKSVHKLVNDHIHVLLMEKDISVSNLHLISVDIAVGSERSVGSRRSLTKSG